MRRPNKRTLVFFTDVNSEASEEATVQVANDLDMFDVKEELRKTFARLWSVPTGEVRVYDEWSDLIED